MHQAPIDAPGWKVIASKLPTSVARRALLVRDAADLSTVSNSKRFQGSAFLSSNTVDIVATKGRFDYLESCLI